MNVDKNNDFLFNVSQNLSWPLINANNSSKYMKKFLHSIPDIF